MKAQTVDGEDSQAVANSIVRHTTTTLGRQAFNMDEVSPSPQQYVCAYRRLPRTKLPLFPYEISSSADGMRPLRALSVSLSRRYAK